MTTSTVSTRLNNETIQMLDELSKATSRPKSFLIAEAVQLYVKEQAWQTKAIREGIKQADKGEFASDDEVKKTFEKWGINAD